MIRIPFFRKKRKAVDLLKIREIIEDNISVERMSQGVEAQYKRFNDPEFAAKELRSRLGIRK